MSASFRSLLFAPGNQPRKIEKVFTLGADVVCLDLEDAVPQTEKERARALVAEALKSPREVPLYVRINALDTPHCLADVEAIVGPRLAGIVLPMVESAAGLTTLDWLLGQLEQRRGLAAGVIDVLPTIETAAGMLDLPEICRAGGRVRRISFGAWDYTLDTGIAYTPDEVGIADARARIVLCSRAARLEAPIDASYPVLGDLEGLRRSCATARAMGFQGKACIHPEQVAPVNLAFSVDAEELRRARAIVSAFEQAEAAGSASIRVEGRFVDYPMYRKAKALVDSLP
jgi:citrate lyase subunit beta/citryl-CoA lyase